jgi:hypothetical protein
MVVTGKRVVLGTATAGLPENADVRTIAYEAYDLGQGRIQVCLYSEFPKGTWWVLGSTEIRPTGDAEAAARELVAKHVGKLRGAS